MAHGAQSDWFLKDERGEHGPFSEPEMRRFVRASESSELEVRQGNSAWHSADVIREKIRELAREGIYIRFKGAAEGPFTLRRAYDVLKPMSPKGIDVRTGKKGDWVEAETWLSKVDRLRAKESSEMESLDGEGEKVTVGRTDIPVLIPRETGRIISDDLDLANRKTTPHSGAGSGQSPAQSPASAQPIHAAPVPAADSIPTVTATPISPSEPVIQAMIVDESTPTPDATPANAIPVADAISVAEAIPVVHATPILSTRPNTATTGVANPPQATQPSRHTPLSQTPSPGPTVAPKIQRGRQYSSPRPVNPATQRSNAKLKKTIAGVLSVLVLVTLFGLKAAGRIMRRMDRSEEQTASQQMQPTATPSASSSIGASSAGPISPNGTSPLSAELMAAYGENVSNAQASSTQVPAPSSPFATRPSASGSQPVVIDSGMLFRPRFGTTSGEVDAGTAFAAKFLDRSGTFVISALHLFGPAGGLSQEIPSARISTAWQSLVLEDCKTQTYFGDVPMQAINLSQAKPLPETSAHGDVVACRVLNSDGMLPMPLSQRTPTAGQRVWLVSKVIGSREMVHAATVEGIQDGWLVYTYDTPRIELRATSGAPVVDEAGNVVAVNAGGGQDGGKTLGVGTPVNKFYAALKSQM